MVVGTHAYAVARPFPEWVGHAVAFTGLTLLVAAWMSVGAALGRKAGPSRAVLLGLATCWAVPFALGPILYSRDVYSYVAQGRLAQLGLNPYRYGPTRLGSGPYLHAVSHVWMRTRAPYGPLFLGIERLVTTALPGVQPASYGMRAVSLVGVGLLVAFLPRLARVHGADERVALWLGVLNPLVLVHFVSGAHNDALMLGLLVTGLALASEGKPGTGLVLCTLAAAVKAPAGLAVAYVAVDWVMSVAPGARRRAAVRALLASFGTFGLITVAVGFGWGWIGALGTPSRIRSLLSPMTATGTLLARAIAIVAPGTDASWTITAVRLVGIAAALAVLTSLFLLRGSYGSGRMLAVSLLAVVLLGPVVQPWYLLWGIMLLAGVGPGCLLTTVIWVSVTLPFLFLPDGHAALDVVLLVFLVLTAGVLWATAPRAYVARASIGVSNRR
jgi:hypothetical protein